MECTVACAWPHCSRAARELVARLFSFPFLSFCFLLLASRAVSSDNHVYTFTGDAFYCVPYIRTLITYAAQLRWCGCCRKLFVSLELLALKRSAAVVVSIRRRFACASCAPFDSAYRLACRLAQIGDTVLPRASCFKFGSRYDGCLSASVMAKSLCFRFLRLGGY